MTRDELAEIKVWWHEQTPETQRDVMRIMNRDYEQYTGGMSIWEFIHEFASVYREERRDNPKPLKSRYHR